MNVLRVSIVLLLTWCFASGAIAESQGGSFNIEHAKETLHTLNQQLSATRIEYNDLYTALATIHELQEQANACLLTSKGQLEKLDALLKDTTIAPTLLQEEHAHYQYLLHERQMNAKRVAFCSFLSFRLQEMQTMAEARMKKIDNYLLLQRSSPIWQQVHLESFSNFSINLKVLYSYSAIGQLNESQRILLLILMSVAFVVGIIFYHIGVRAQKKSHDYPILKGIKNYLPALFPLGLCSIYLHLMLPFVSPFLKNIFLSDVLFFYFLVHCLIKLYVDFLLKNKLWFNKNVMPILLRRSKILIHLILLGSLGIFISHGQSIPTQLMELCATLYITILSCSFLWLSWLIFQLDYFKHHASFLLPRLIKLILVIVFFVPILMAWFGYQDFALFFIPNLIATICLLALFWRVSVWLGYLYAVLSDLNHQTASKLRAMVGISQHETLIELFVIRLILNLGVLFLTTIGLLLIWRAPQYYIDAYFSIIYKGFKLYEIPITPVRILRGCFIFCIIMVIGRVIATRVAGFEAFKDEKDRQITVSTLITYIAFLIALFTGLMIAGVNFTSFALVAGAFSVGIGFGLQNIANDFVSGLILLINKPVKPGDHIAIGDVEGHVKKIRLLSTQIVTLAHSDAMIPNSHLIGKSVTNYTFHNNRYVKTNIQIMIEHGDDIQKARQIILDVLAKSKQVVQDANNQPTVLYELVFSYGVAYSFLDIWCVIKDVNKKHMITSELTMVIIDALKANDIQVKLN